MISQYAPYFANYLQYSYPTFQQGKELPVALICTGVIIFAPI